MSLTQNKHVLLVYSTNNHQHNSTNGSSSNDRQRSPTTLSNNKVDNSLQKLAPSLHSPKSIVRFNRHHQHLVFSCGGGKNSNRQRQGSSSLSSTAAQATTTNSCIRVNRFNSSNIRQKKSRRASPSSASHQGIHKERKSLAKSSNTRRKNWSSTATSHSRQPPTEQQNFMEESCLVLLSEMNIASPVKTMTGYNHCYHECDDANDDHLVDEANNDHHHHSDTAMNEDCASPSSLSSAPVAAGSLTSQLQFSSVVFDPFARAHHHHVSSDLSSPETNMWVAPMHSNLITSDFLMDQYNCNYHYHRPCVDGGDIEEAIEFFGSGSMFPILLSPSNTPTTTAAEEEDEDLNMESLIRSSSLSRSATSTESSHFYHSSSSAALV